MYSGSTMAQVDLVTGQNDTDKIVAISIDSNSIEFEFLFSNHKSQISDTPKWVYVETGLMKKITL